MNRVQDQLRQLAETDLTALEQRQEQWKKECGAKLRPRARWWLGYGQRDIGAARARLERILTEGGE